MRHIKENLDSEIVANYVLEYFYRYLEDNNPNQDEYDILYHSLKALDHGYSPLLVYLLFNVFVLNHNGVSIDVEGCVVCGSSKVTAISLRDGGFVCQNHRGNLQPCDINVLKAFRHIHKIPIQYIDHIHIEENILKELIPYMNGYIEEYTGVSLKTSAFIQQIV